ncbi:MAG TPA: hypothetical protein VK797_15965 [Tepidisphaeraceae bacterium]|nr:hypothetical protein [Tepidisphaeraceae bacterium]
MRAGPPLQPGLRGTEALTGRGAVGTIRRPFETDESVSNYPQPVPPPQGPFGFDSYRPLPAPLAAARRASVMLWIIGPLILMCGLCVGVVGMLAPMDQLLQQFREYSPEQAQQFSTPQMQMALRVAYGFISVVALLTGLGMTASAWFVRRARRGGVITALVACVPLVVWALLAMLGGLAALAAGALLGVVQLVIGVGIAAVIGLTVSWLWRALRAGGMADQQQFMQQQYWQYLQQQQAQQGYGYGPPGAMPQSPSQQTPWMDLPPAPLAPGAAPASSPPAAPSQNPPEPPPAM